MMEIEEVKKRKKALENEIEELLLEFIVKSEVTISNIKFARIASSSNPVQIRIIVKL